MTPLTTKKKSWLESFYEKRQKIGDRKMRLVALGKLKI